MRQKLTSIIICPGCKSPLRLEISDKSKSRVHNGGLLCKKCNIKFGIIDDIVCFKSVTLKDKNKTKLQKIRDLFLQQEYKKEWLKHFTKQELPALKKEWDWMVNNLNLKKNKIHLDWATGTGRFLRNILKIIKGEVIVVEFDYPTCLGLRAFLKKIGKYSNVTIIYGDARIMPFSDNSIDSISSWHGLDEPNINKAIDESKRVLKLNKVFSAAGLFYKKESESLKIAKKWKIEFAEENMAYRYFKRVGFKNIKHKTFFKGKWLERGSFLPRFGDYYTSYAISGRK